MMPPTIPGFVTPSSFLLFSSLDRWQVSNENTDPKVVAGSDQTVRHNQTWQSGASVTALPRERTAFSSAEGMVPAIFAANSSPFPSLHHLPW